MSPVPGQRAAQTPARAAVASSRALGRAATAPGALTGRLHIRLTGADPYVLAIDPATGGEVTTTADGRTVPVGHTSREEQ